MNLHRKTLMQLADLPVPGFGGARQGFRGSAIETSGRPRASSANPETPAWHR